MRCPIYVALVTIPVLLFAGKAGAQPTLTSAPGKGQEVVYVFQGGVSDDSAPNDAATVVYCTNLSSQDPVGVRVEFFGPAGFQIDSLSSNDIEPGHTKIFASQPLALIVNELNMATPQMVPAEGPAERPGRGRGQEGERPVLGSALDPPDHDESDRCAPGRAAARQAEGQVQVVAPGSPPRIRYGSGRRFAA